MAPVELHSTMHGRIKIRLRRFADGCYCIDIEDMDEVGGLKYVVNEQLEFEYVKHVEYFKQGAHFLMYHTVSPTQTFLCANVSGQKAVLTEVTRCLVRILVASHQGSSGDSQRPDSIPTSQHPEDNSLLLTTKKTRSLARPQYDGMGADMELLFRACVVRAMRIMRTVNYFAASLLRGLARRQKAGALIARRVEAAALSPYTQLGRARLQRDFAALSRLE